MHASTAHLLLGIRYFKGYNYYDDIISSSASIVLCPHPVPPPLLSSPSIGLQGQQLVQPVQEVPQRRQVPEHALHLRQAGSRRRFLHYAHRLRALLVALRRQDSAVVNFHTRKKKPTKKTVPSNKTKTTALF